MFYLKKDSLNFTHSIHCRAVGDLVVSESVLTKIAADLSKVVNCFLTLWVL